MFFQWCSNDNKAKYSICFDLTKAFDYLQQIKKNCCPSESLRYKQIHRGAPTSFIENYINGS